MYEVVGVNETTKDQNTQAISLILGHYDVITLEANRK